MKELLWIEGAVQCRYKDKLRELLLANKAEAIVKLVQEKIMSRQCEHHLFAWT